MRRRLPWGITILGLITASGIGTYLGAALVGIGAVVTGGVSSDWLGGLVFFLMIGAVGGWFVAVMLRYRRLPVVAGGAVSFALAIAGAGWHPHQATIVVILLAGVSSTLRYAHHRHRAARRVHSSHVQGSLHRHGHPITPSRS